MARRVRPAGFLRADERSRELRGGAFHAGHEIDDVENAWKSSDVRLSAVYHGSNSDIRAGCPPARASNTPSSTI